MSISMQCLDCKHYTGLSTCDAFPDKIPQEIFDGTFDHTNEYPGDGGIRFENIERSSVSKMIEVDIRSLAKSKTKKPILIRRTAERKAHYRMQEVGSDVTGVKTIENNFIRVTSAELADDISKYGLTDIKLGVNLDGLEDKKVESIIGGLEKSIGKYNIKIDYVGWNPVKEKVAAVYKERGIGKHLSISFQKTGTKRSKLVSNKNVKAYQSDKPKRVDKLQYLINEFPIIHGRRDKGKLEKLKKCNRWLVSDGVDDPLSVLSAHEGFHCVYHQKGIEDKWNENLLKYVGEEGHSDIKCMSVSEYGCSSVSELFAEVGAAITHGINIDPAVKQAFEKTMEGVK